ncbi:MAG: hypothetical protein ACR2O4_06570 [Hyphomicrobiaceae bacterium]
MAVEFTELTFEELLAQRAVARLALKRGRRPERTAAVIARIERELDRRRVANLVQSISTKAD